VTVRPRNFLPLSLTQASRNLEQPSLYLSPTAYRYRTSPAIIELPDLLSLPSPAMTAEYAVLSSQYFPSGTSKTLSHFSGRLQGQFVKQWQAKIPSRVIWSHPN
jgi:hypothetical protein